MLPMNVKFRAIFRAKHKAGHRPTISRIFVAAVEYWNSLLQKGEQSDR